MGKSIDFKNLSPNYRHLAAQVDDKTSPVHTYDELNNLRKRYRAAQTSFLERYADMIQPGTVGSYLCNIVSAIGLFYVVRILMEIIPLPYVGVVVGLIALYFFEKYKRKFSDGFWDSFWMNFHGRISSAINWRYFVLNIGLFALSLFGTVFGIYFFIIDNSPEARFMGQTDDPEAIAILDDISTQESKIATLKMDNEKARADQSNYNAQGEFYFPMQKAETSRLRQIEQIEASIAAQRSTLSQKHGTYTIKNADIQKMWKMRNDTRMTAGVGAAFILEFIFEFLMAFLSLYGYKKMLFLEALARQGKQAV